MTRSKADGIQYLKIMKIAEINFFVKKTLSKKSI